MADFQESLEKLASLTVNVIAGSADGYEDAKQAVDELGIAYPLAYGLDVAKICAILGGYYGIYKEANPLEGSEEEREQITASRRKYFEPTGLLVRPDRTIEIVCYSSGHVGRLHAKEVGSLVKYLLEQK